MAVKGPDNGCLELTVPGNNYAASRVLAWALACSYLLKAIAASFMVIASASFFHYSDPALFVGKNSEGPTYKIGLLLPVAYTGFIRLQRSRIYLGPDRPTGFRGGLWTLGMGISTLVLVGFLSWFAYARIPGWIQSL